MVKGCIKILSLAVALTMSMPLFGQMRIINTGINDAITGTMEAVANLEPVKWCIDGDQKSCGDITAADKQMIVVPAGYTTEDYDLFRADFDKLAELLSEEAGGAFTTMYADRIIYRGIWATGGVLGSKGAVFSSRVAEHPTRGKFLALDQGQVINLIKSEQAKDKKIMPMGVLVLFNTLDGSATPNAVPSSYTGAGFGIAKISRSNLSSSYAGAHELSHAALNFLDEYVEYGFDEMNVNSLNSLTPLVLIDGSWGSWVNSIANFFGIYNIRLSEIIAAGGNDNIDVTKYPSRVATSNYAQNAYEYEGGMFFGRGTWHDRGNNIMNGNRVKRGPDDGFAFAHSGAQQDVVKNAILEPDKAPRPNDRIRNAGPNTPLGLSLGSSVKALMFDADKHHAFHPTTSYDVQITWEEKSLKKCSKWGVPYPCVELKRRTVQKNVKPVKRYVDLSSSGLGQMTGFVQSVLCSVGIGAVGGVDVCSMDVSEMQRDLLPTYKFLIPYQEINIPTEQRLTEYQWRFKTHNGTMASGWTGWATIRRAF